MLPLLRLRHLFTLITAALSIMLIAAACSSTGGKPRDIGAGGMGAGTADTPRKVVAMIGHYGPGVAFADLIRKGAEAAAAKDNIELRFSTDPDAPTQANMVQAAVDSKVDGIAVTLAKPDAMASAVKAAVADGIPVVGFNAGFDAWQDLGMLGFFGQDETIAGREAGKRLAAEGAKKTLCVIHEQGNVSLEARCAGVKEGLAGGQIENLYVNGNDMTAVQSTITAKLQQDPTIDHIATLYSAIGMTALQAKEAASSNATIVTFDTSPELVEAINNHQIAWTIDQQPFLQGYLAVDSLWLYLNNRNMIGGGSAVLTGPAFIDTSNISVIAEYAKRGTR